MKYIEILASFFSGYGLRQEAGGLAIVSGALLAGGIYLWLVSRALKKEAAEELERERHGKNIP